MQNNQLAELVHEMEVGDVFTTPDPKGIVYDSDTKFTIDDLPGADSIAYFHTSVKQKINKLNVCSLALFAIRLERYGLTVKTSKAKANA